MEILDAWWAVIRDGLYHIQPVQFVIIAILFGLTASSLVSSIFGSIAASAVYVAVSSILPVVTEHKLFAMPNFDQAFWHFFLSLTAAFLVVILVVYILKSLVASLRG
jgi:hypothetical protein